MRHGGGALTSMITMAAPPPEMTKKQAAEQNATGTGASLSTFLTTGNVSFATDRYSRSCGHTLYNYTWKRTEAGGGSCKVSDADSSKTKGFCVSVSEFYRKNAFYQAMLRKKRGSNPKLPILQYKMVINR